MVGSAMFTTREIARMLALYWPQSLPYGERVLDQIGGSRRSLVARIIELCRLDILRLWSGLGRREFRLASAFRYLPWVQKADAMFRRTGSWLTVFVAIDPVG